ncbi:polyprenyl synthetase family protein [Phototrophicus methaneseepsis]|uniref:Polyprenyl synthetase family protein n=1 Tax=Phototrophicus methaneseepsis TaxID=2710758 RepID=A0A7S8E6H4_9CHLR|nr:polyprenyl synthetase family protein [Phototrophicus methaneseepsis]QPC81184.1 polyprenyl synthetase family protein [Phototrophicus methaneseepsis]
MFATFVQRYWDTLNSTLQSIVETELTDEPGFGLMVRYAMGWETETGEPYHLPTGKRLRPTLLLLTTEAAGGDWHDAIYAAAAVELLHNFSLIHDDIQDDSPLRHNRPTVWQVWGIANAINAGDAMFALAYAALAKSSAHIAPNIALDLWHIFNRTNLELTRGQHLDMRFETQETVSPERYISMLKGKTASLLSACTEMGALIATGDRERANKFAEFGLNIGIAFQIRDDILGIWGDPSVTGKSAATDIETKKKSLPVLYGLAHSEHLTELYRKPEFTQAETNEVIEILDDIQAQAFTREQEEGYHARAMAALEEAEPTGEAAEALHAFVDMLFQRNF